MMYRRAVFLISPAFYPIFSFRQLLDAVMAQIQRESERKSCYVYFADALQAISQNVAKITGGNYMGKRLIDILEPPTDDGKTADEIIAEIRGELAMIGGAEDGRIA